MIAIIQFLLMGVVIPFAVGLMVAHAMGKNKKSD